MNYPTAHAVPGPPAKQNGGINRCTGVVCHSMVGSYAAALGELKNPERRASWHYSVLQNGAVIAHYADEAQTWHAGSAFNNFTIGIEHEGGLGPYNEPLTPRQTDASVSLVRWLAQAHGFPLVRQKGLWEHREVSDKPTACPSGRIPWEKYPLPPPVEEDDDMKPVLVWNRDRQQVWFMGPFGAVPVVYPADALQLEKLYGAHAAALSNALLESIAQSA
jgi:hypothetical protein